MGATVELAFAILAFHYLLVPLTASLSVGSLVIFGLVSICSADARVLHGAVKALVIATAVALVFWPLKHLGLLEQMWVVALALIVIAPTALIALSYLYITMRLNVTAPPTALDAADRQRIARLMEAEDHPELHSIYNHVAGLSVMKTCYRPLRWLRSWLALRFLNLFYRTYFVRGKLSSITSIHFAQWTLLRDRMLFLTNYDGSADSYLDDFFTALAKGVAFIWYDMSEFPGTTDPRGLKLWVRSGQTLAAARYRAAVYDGLSVEMINNNLEIRSRLLRGFRKESARRWMRRFATTPVEPTLLWKIAHWYSGRRRVMP
jgi:hypothetical protein